MRAQDFVSVCVLVPLLSTSVRAQDATTSLPASVGAYHLVYRDSASWFSNGTTTVAVVVRPILATTGGDSVKSARALRDVEEGFGNSIVAAQKTGIVDSYRRAFSAPDSATTAAGKIPGWAIAIATKQGDAVSIHLCYAFVLNDRVIQAITTIPAEAIRTTDMPVFAHELVRRYAGGS